MLNDEGEAQCGVS